MARIALIGAGSVVFTRNLTNDILSCPDLRDSTIALMDIDAERLELALALVQKMIDARGLPATVEATLDRREALKGARYVITTIQVGGLEAFEHDIAIPAKYGVGQCVGDTLGPGGIFRGYGVHSAANPTYGGRVVRGRGSSGCCHSRRSGERR